VTSAHVWRRVTAAIGTTAALVAGVLSAAPTAAQTPSNGLHSWNFHQAHVTAASQDTGRDGVGVRVAIIDTWVDTKHRDLAGRVTPGVDCTSGVCVPGKHKDDCGHGTHVAGTVAASHWGVAPRATILPVQVLTYDSSHDECSGSTSDVAAGIRWATQNNASIINLSLAAQLPGLGTASPVTSAVREAIQQGIVVVFAAGNNNRPVADNYGGDAIIVAATAPSGAIASYSQHGLGVSVAAPGGQPRGGDCAADGSDCVISAWPFDGQGQIDHNSYAALAGTSMAAPHVSGLAALLLAEHPTWTNTQVRERIEATAHALSGGGEGLIDVARAVGATSDGNKSPEPKHSSKPSQRATAAGKSSNSPSPKASPSPDRPKKKQQPTPRSTGRPTPEPQPSGTPTAADSDDDLPTLPLALAVACLAGVGVALVRQRHLFSRR